MKLTKSQLKELIRYSIREVISEKSDVMDKKIKYKDKEGNEKESTVGGILKKGENHPAHKQAKAMVDKDKGTKKITKKTKIDANPFDPDPPKKEPEMTAGGPAHANVPKGAKTSKDAIGMKKAQDLAKSAIPKDTEKDMMDASNKANKKMEIDVLNKQAEKGDGAQIDTEYGTVTWTNGDPDEDSFIATNEDGEEIEVDYADIVRFHNDSDSIMKNLMGGEEKPKRPEAMNDLDWDNEIEPHELEGWVQDNIKKIPPALKNNVNKLVDRYEDLYSQEDYDGAAVVQKKLDNELTKYMGKSYRNESIKIKESKLKNIIRQAIKEVVTEEKIYKAKKKNGKVVVFKDKDNWKDALKTGDYEKLDSKKGKPTKKAKVSKDPFSKGEEKPKVNRKELVRKQDDVARSMGADHTADIIKRGTPDKLQDFTDAIDDEGQDHNKINKAIEALRNNPDNMKIRQKIFNLATLKALKPEKKSKETYPGPDGDYDVKDVRGGYLAVLADKNADKKVDDILNKINTAVESGASDEEVSDISYDEIENYIYNDLGADPKSNFSDDLRSQVSDMVWDKRTDKYKNESVNESKQRKYTIKEVRMWMKKLEENRYKKVYNSDARRVAWMCNHIGENLENMPKSMRKKWTKAQYGRERYLAKEFLKSQLASLKEQKLKKAIREIIKEVKLEEARFAELYFKNDKRTQNIVSKIIKKMRLKIDKDYDVKAIGSSGREQKFMILPKHRNKFLELLIKNKIKVRG